nr:hypothetical protein [Tanacetum cinerariifolium]
MPPRKVPRTKTAPATATATTPMTDAAIRALISRGVADALPEHEIQRNNNLNGDVNQGSKSGITRPVRPTLGHDATYGVSWSTLMKMITTKYIPQNEIKKLEMEVWELKVKGTDLASYTQRFQELALMCRRMFPEESDKIKRYVGGLPDMIHGSVMASRPKTMHDAFEFSTELMDKKIHTLAERQAENKKRFDNNNQAQQQPPKKQGVATAYTVRPGERKEYAGTLPLCNKCKFHNNGQCTVKCANYKRVGHLTRDCRSPVATNNQRNLTFYECGNQGHHKSDCLKLKNQNHKNQAEGTEARGMVYALGGGETDQDPNNTEDEIKA